MSSELLIQRAQQYLTESPFDAGYDLDHHQRVVNNCLIIVEKEGLELDLEVLVVAAWWHDIERKDLERNNQLLRSAAEDAGIDVAIAEKGIHILNSHSFGNSQEDLEAQVLFDADKIEYVSAPRIRRVLAAVERGEMTDAVWEKYKVALGERIPHVPGMLHFEASKALFKQQLGELQAWIQEDPRLADLWFLLDVKLA
jgi:HD superfamily phosphodiesterase